LANYDIVYTPGFRKALHGLSTVDYELVLEKTKIMEGNPFHPSHRTKKMQGRFRRYESSVTKSIRLIWDFDEGKIILMLDVGHHDILDKH
jgi:mRNA-degrading endonuclease RelE of RelBE toxin-antitoxin system